MKFPSLVGVISTRCSTYKIALFAVGCLVLGSSWFVASAAPANAATCRWIKTGEAGNFSEVDNWDCGSGRRHFPHINDDVYIEGSVGLFSYLTRKVNFDLPDATIKSLHVISKGLPGKKGLPGAALRVASGSHLKVLGDVELFGTSLLEVEGAGLLEATGKLGLSDMSEFSVNKEGQGGSAMFGSVVVNEKAQFIVRPVGAVTVGNFLGYLSDKGGKIEWNGDVTLTGDVSLKKNLPSITSFAANLGTVIFDSDHTQKFTVSFPITFNKVKVISSHSDAKSHKVEISGYAPYHTINSDIEVQGAAFKATPVLTIHGSLTNDNGVVDLSDTKIKGNLVNAGVLKINDSNLTVDGAVIQQGQGEFYAGNSTLVFNGDVLLGGAVFAPQLVGNYTMTLKGDKDQSIDMSGLAQKDKQIKNLMVDMRAPGNVMAALDIVKDTLTVRTGSLVLTKNLSVKKLSIAKGAGVIVGKYTLFIVKGGKIDNQGTLFVDTANGGAIIDLNQTQNSQAGVALGNNSNNKSVAGSKVPTGNIGVVKIISLGELPSSTPFVPLLNLDEAMKKVKNTSGSALPNLAFPSADGRAVKAILASNGNTLVTYTIINTGAVVAPAFKATALVQMPGDRNIYSVQSVVRRLKPGESYTVSNQLVKAAFAKATAVTITLDPADEVAETSEDDNGASLEIIRDIAVQPPALEERDANTTAVTVAVKNEGNAGTGSSVAKIVATLSNGKTFSFTRPLASLSAGKGATLKLTLPVALEDIEKITVNADSNNKVNETDEENNSASYVAPEEDDNKVDSEEEAADSTDAQADESDAVSEKLQSATKATAVLKAKHARLLEQEVELKRALDANPDSQTAREREIQTERDQIAARERELQAEQEAAAARERELKAEQEAATVRERELNAEKAREEQQTTAASQNQTYYSLPMLGPEVKSGYAQYGL